MGGVKKNVAKVTGNDESEAKSKPLSAYVRGACPSPFPDYHVCTMIELPNTDFLFVSAVDKARQVAGDAKKTANS